MPSHEETRYSPHSPEELYTLVMDIESYPKFLPWCVGARILSRDEAMVVADLIIRFKAFREKFTSEVTFEPNRFVRVHLVEGPFTHLENYWEFRPHPEGGTEIHFSVDFAFRSKILEKLIGVMFERAVEKMVSSFEARADALYGR